MSEMLIDERLKDLMINKTCLASASFMGLICNMCGSSTLIHSNKSEEHHTPNKLFTIMNDLCEY